MKYELNAKHKDQISQELEWLNKLETSKANIIDQFFFIGEKLHGDLEL